MSRKSQEYDHCSRMVIHQILITIDLSHYTFNFKNYMSHTAVFFHEQFGFRTGHSTEQAALQLNDYWIKQMDQGGAPLNIY